MQTQSHLHYSFHFFHSTHSQLVLQAGMPWHVSCCRSRHTSIPAAEVTHNTMNLTVVLSSSSLIIPPFSKPKALVARLFSFSRMNKQAQQSVFCSFISNCKHRNNGFTLNNLPLPSLFALLISFNEPQISLTTLLSAPPSQPPALGRKSLKQTTHYICCHFLHLDKYLED